MKKKGQKPVVISDRKTRDHIDGFILKKERKKPKARHGNVANH